MATEREINTLLFERYKNSDKSARDEIIKRNLPLVRSISRRFCTQGQNSEDIFQIGVIGLIKAVDRYDEKYGYAFSTYAFSLISGEIKRFLRDDGLIKVSRKLKKNASIVLEAKKRFYLHHGREPRLSEISAICSLTEEEITECLDASYPIHSLSEQLGDDGITIAETVAQDDVFSPIIDILALKQEIISLDSMEKQLVNLRFYKNLTQSQTAKILGISQVTVSRMEKKILLHLRENLIPI